MRGYGLGAVFCLLLLGGGLWAEEAEDPLVWEPVRAQLTGSLRGFGEGFGKPGGQEEAEGLENRAPRKLNNLLLGLVGARGYELRGFGLGTLWLLNDGPVRGAGLSGGGVATASTGTGLLLAGLGVTSGGSLYGLQGAGLAVVAGGSLSGVQGAGLAVLAGDAMGGLQAAALGLVSGGPMYGFQGAALAVVSGGSLSGFSLAGLASVAGGSVSGFQASGLANVAGNSASGVQAAGLANVAGGSVNGLQIAGLGNAAGGPFRGIQIAGLGNAAGGPFWGIQAGIYNRLYDGEGAALQVGLVNISENPRTLSLGLVNIVKNGLLHPAIYLDDLGFINAGFRSGSRQVYSLLSLGVLPPGDGEGFFVSRLGLGWEIALASFFIDLDAAAGSFIPLDGLGKFRDAKEEGRISLDLQVRLTAGYRIFKRLGLFAGISYSWLFPPGEGSPVPRSPLNPLPAGTGGGNRQRIGFFGGLEF